MPRAERAAPYGNYKGYYTKRGNLTSDPRLRALPAGIFNGKRVLDIGCNEGWVTCEIARRYEALEVVGVDIDADLIGRAWRHRRQTWSLQAPTELPKDSHAEPSPGSKEADNMLRGNEYFPECFPNLFGPIPISAHNKSFPNNTAFHVSDWAKQGCVADQPGYDVVVAFSVSKWVHVHGGDEGIKAFFSRVRDVLHARANPASPGIFILEAQPWTGYHNAMRKVNLYEANQQRPQERIKITPDEFPEILAELGFSQPQRVGIVGEGGFRRPIDIYELRSQ